MKKSKPGCWLLSVSISLTVGAAQPYVITTVAGGAPPPAKVALQASISPLGATTDSAGNVYFSSRHAVYRFGPAGDLTRIAGTARPGFAGDGGSAVDAQLNNPIGLANDAAGNLYIADSGNNVIRRVSTSGVISTVVGATTATTVSLLDEGAPASQAWLIQPFGVAFDSTGTLYLADYHSVRKITAEGRIKTIIGCIVNCSPIHVTAFAVAPNGTVYESDGHIVQKITPDGLVSRVAGIASATNPFDSGLATDANLGSISGLALNAKGELYIADQGSGRILRIAVDGTLQTVAGNFQNASMGDGGPASAAGLAGPVGLAFDASGNLYIAEFGAQWVGFGNGATFDSGRHVRKIAVEGSITTVAGNGTKEYSGDGNPSANAQLDAPWGVAVDVDGNIFLSDLGNHTIRRIAADGVISTVAGTAVAGFSGDGGEAARAQLNAPLGLALDSAGSLYVAECTNQTVRRISPAGVITTVAGNGTTGAAGDGDLATNAQFSCPHGVVVDASGNLYIADTGNHRIRKVTPGGVISTIAGTGIHGFAGDGGPAVRAQLDSPTGLALDSAGNLFVADTANNRIRRISGDGVIATVAGSADRFHTYGDDGLPATSAVLSAPQGLAIDPAGNLYIADTQSNHVRRVTTRGIISTIAGRGLYGIAAYFDDNSFGDAIYNFSTSPGQLHGFSGDGGPAASALLAGPYGLVIDSSSNLYLADLPNSAVRKLSPMPIANAASGLYGPITAGEIVTLYGSHLGPADVAAGESGGTGVFFDGVAAQVIYTSATQVAAVVPQIVGSTANIEVRYAGNLAAAFSADVGPAAPALFTADSTGKGLASAVYPKHGVILETAFPGDTVTLFATGDGLFSHPDAPVSATVGGANAEVVHIGPAPGRLGVTQIDVKVPAYSPVNDVNLGGGVPFTLAPVKLQVGHTTSQFGVFITGFAGFLRPSE